MAADETILTLRHILNSVRRTLSHVHVYTSPTRALLDTLAHELEIEIQTIKHTESRE